MLAPLGEALKIILKKVSDFFDLLDLSFFVAGGASLTALLSLGHMLELSPLPEDPGLGALLGFVLLAYIMGLCCFALGRALRGPISVLVPGPREAPNWRDLLIREAVVAHGLQDDPIVGPYLAQPNCGDRLYTRMWVELRERPDLQESYNFVRRFWILAATYDGVSFAAILWAAVVALGLHEDLHSPVSNFIAAGVSIALLCVALACVKEARKYGQWQLEEVVASMAHLAASRAEAKSRDQ